MLYFTDYLGHLSLSISLFKSINEIFALRSMSSLSTSSTKHDVINLVDDTDDMVVVIEKITYQLYR